MPTAVLAQWGLPLILSAMLSTRSGIKAEPEPANYDDTILYIRVSGWLRLRAADVGKEEIRNAVTGRPAGRVCRAEARGGQQERGREKREEGH